MPLTDFQQQIADQFHAWEMVGRGDLAPVDDPISPEPPFRPFRGYKIRRRPVVDDGTRHTWISRFLASTRPPEPEPEAAEEEDEDFDFDFCDREDQTELLILATPDWSPDSRLFAECILQMEKLQKPVAIELVGTAEQTELLVTVENEDANRVEALITTCFPELVVHRKSREHDTLLGDIWSNGPKASEIVELALSRAFFLPLAEPSLSALSAMVGTLSQLTTDDIGVLQVLFEPAQRDWSCSLTQGLLDDDTTGRVFADQKKLVRAAQEKAESKLYGVVVRLAARSQNFQQVWEILTRLGSALRPFDDPNGNAFYPVEGEDYDSDTHEMDLLKRQSRRFGMLLTHRELCALVRFPTAETSSPKFLRCTRRTKAAPVSLLESPRGGGGGGVCLGENPHRHQSAPVYLSDEERVRHMHIVGASGTGKSTLLLRLIGEDIKRGEGITVLDPHGDLCDAILAAVPDDRIDDVILLDPSDGAASIPFNILSAHSDAERTILSSDLVSIFQRLSTSWGEQMNAVFRNAVLAFLDSDRGGTLADMRQFLMDERFRKQFLPSVRDRHIRNYWETFPSSTLRGSVAAVVTRLETFLAPKALRYMVAQKACGLDFGSIMDDGKILLCRLSQGLIGKENAFLLGSLVLSKLQQTAMTRQRMNVELRRNHWVYVDEFQNFITPSMAEILAEARKYRMGLTLAHQTLTQLSRDSDVLNAVLGTTNVRVVFRVGDADARGLASGFADFDVSDIQSLEIGEAICRVGRSDHDFNLRVRLPDAVDPDIARARRERVMDASRRRHATPREEVERELFGDQEEAVDTVRPSKSVPPPDSPAKPPVQTDLADPNSTATVDAASTGAPEAKPTKAKSREVLDAPEPDRRESSLPGKGGSEHRALQNLIKSAAQFVGFRATVEKDIGSGMNVDVVAEDDGQRIAIEISVSTPSAHEIGNIRKCLEAGFDHVIFACADAGKLNIISKLVEREFPGRSNVHCVLTGNVGDLLRLAKGAPPSPTVSTDPVVAPVSTPGTKLSHSIKVTNPVMAAEQRKAALKKLTKAMQR